jgi:hypothetical protein
MDPANFAPYLRTSWHSLSVKGDLRSQYAPFDNPPASGAPIYSYIKCGTVAGTTEIQLIMQNQDEVASTIELSTGLIYDDVQLYAEDLATFAPGLTYPPPPFAWTDAPGSPVTVNPGARVKTVLSIPTPTTEQTLVIRAKVSGAALWVQTLSPDFCEQY